MIKEELMDYGKFIDNYLTEISSIMWMKHKITSLLGRKIDYKLAMNSRQNAHGNKN